MPVIDIIAVSRVCLITLPLYSRLYPAFLPLLTLLLTAGHDREIYFIQSISVVFYNHFPYLFQHFASSPAPQKSCVVKVQVLKIFALSELFCLNLRTGLSS